MTRPSQRARDFQSFYVVSVATETGRLTTKGHNVTRPNFGEPDSSVPLHVFATLKESSDGRPLLCTDALDAPELRRVVVIRCKELHGLKITPERICVTSGAFATLSLALATLVSPGGEVLLDDPSYPYNRQILFIFSVKVRLIDMTPESRS